VVEVKVLASTLVTVLALVLEVGHLHHPFWPEVAEDAL